MIASLMMYMRPELADAHDRYWSLIRDRLRDRGIAAPDRLSRDADRFAVWNDPALVLSQTCGMPYRLWLRDKVCLVGTPDFGVDGCPPGWYRSAIVVRGSDGRRTLDEFRDAVFAYNQTHSQSGYAAPFAHLKPYGFWFANRLEAGLHASSARAVAAGTADIAAIDAVTWRQLDQYEAFAGDLRVLEWTEPTPGLPYIAARDADGGALFEAVAAAIAALQPADRELLGLRGIVAIPKEAYFAVPDPDE